MIIFITMIIVVTMKVFTPKPGDGRRLSNEALNLSRRFAARRLTPGR
jgi:hypothetical protein